MKHQTACKYLQTYAENETRQLPQDSIKPADAVLVIPAYKEQPNFLSNLLSSSFKEVRKLLLILVSNHPNDLSADNLKAAQEAHQALIKQLPTASWRDNTISYYETPTTAVLLVDKTGIHALDPNGGVGLARKIGADIAFSLIKRNVVKTPWIFNTDADSHLPTEYFSSTAGLSTSVAGLIYPFTHTGAEGKLLEATRLYEKKLDLYVDGLKAAGSPYAFHTVGSTIAIHATAYASIRGFPKRSAGEDFYVLNKLAKIGEVKSLASPMITISARCSDRIPFGTGPAVSRLLQAPNPRTEKIFYHPNVFNLLKLFLAVLQQNPKPETLDELPAEAHTAAQQIGIERFFKHVEKQSLEGSQYSRHFHQWFDAFKTLKFIHCLRDTYFPNIDDQEICRLKQRSLPPK